MAKVVIAFGLDVVRVIAHATFHLIAVRIWAKKVMRLYLLRAYTVLDPIHLKSLNAPYHLQPKLQDHVLLFPRL